MESIVREIKMECKGGPKVHLGRVTAYMKKNYLLFGHILTNSKNVPAKDRRDFILNNVCSTLGIAKQVPPPIVKKPSSKEKKKDDDGWLVSKPKPKPSDKGSDKPAVKPPQTEHVSQIKVKLNVQPASKAYLKDLQNELAQKENDTYSIEALERDIKNVEFVKQAVVAHDQALAYKLKVYRKLAKVDWNNDNEENRNQFPGPREQGVNLSQVVSNMIDKIKDEITIRSILPMETKIAQKQESLHSILYDADNGIATIRGTSRSNVRLMLIKTMYMFFKVPEFFFTGFINFMITGPAGSGKTKVAGVIAHMFRNLGILAGKKVVMATKQNLVGQFVGHSGPKTRAALSNALEGVFFIDEAYSLTPCPNDDGGAGGDKSFSDEAMAEVINFLDKFIGCLVVIVAGYKDKMHNCFLTFNEGIARRFPKMLDFAQYTNEDMFNILNKFMKESMNEQTVLSKHQRSLIKGYVFALNEQNVFNNQAGDMLNLAKALTEDAVLLGSDFNDASIQMVFKKFCAGKNLALNF